MADETEGEPEANTRSCFQFNNFTANSLMTPEDEL